MTRGKKKPKEGAHDRPAQPKKTDEGYRPFAALKGMKVDAEKDGPQGSPAHARPPAPRPPPPPPLLHAEEEAQALQRMMSGVTPLGSKAKRIPRSEESLPTSHVQELHAAVSAPLRVEDESAHAHLRALVEGGRFEVEDDGEHVEGRRAGVPPEALRKLRRGLLPIDARLDLHGLRTDAAHEALERFLAEKRARGERCVVVVHGKGEHSPGGIGILRGEIAAWLSQGRASAHVAAFATAQPHDGGGGATYVLLVR